MKSRNLYTFIPIMLTFFAMGFVDLVGIATNYVKADFELTDTMANLLSSMVFLWFLVLSVPAGLLMNRIGRKKTVLLSLVVTLLSLVIPLVNYSFESMLISFTLLGIGNTIMQVSLNPLIASVVSKDSMASTLTFGQFIKAVASFIAPILASWAMLKWGDWRNAMYPLFAAIAGGVILLLSFVKIEEEKSDSRSVSILRCFSLLGDVSVLILFLGIMAHVGLDVGINTSAPKILMERFGMDLTKASFATSFYFIFRTTGCLFGSWLLAKFPSKVIFGVSSFMILAGISLLFTANATVIYIGIVLFGLGNANIFPIIFARALQHRSDMQNEVSGLMIMGICGGAIFPLVMGLASDTIGSQMGVLIVLAVCSIFLIVGVIPKIKNA